MQAMIFAAGLGTRFKPWTDTHPKALALINGKSLLQRNVEYLQKYNIRDIVINVHHFAEQVIDAIKINNGWGSTISISNETNQLLETGGGLKKAEHFFKDDIIVILNADILTDFDLSLMINYHLQKNSLATLAITDRSTSRYFLFDENNTVCGWRNTKTGEEKISRPSNNLSQKAFSGIHIVSKKIFPLIKQQGKFSIVDVYLELAKITDLKGFDHSGSKLVDVGKPESVAIAEEYFK